MSITSAIFKLANKLPQNQATILSQLTALFFLFLKKNYRNEIKTNYQKIFGFYEPGFWLKQSRQLGRNLGLMLQIGKNKKILDKIEICRENILCDIMEVNKAAVVVSFHYGPWELLAQVFQKRGYQSYILVEAQRDQDLNVALERLRNRNGVKTVEKISEVKKIISNQSNQRSARRELFGFLLDNTSKTRGLCINQPWPGFSILRTPFVLAKYKKLPILSMFCYNKNGNVIIDIDKVENPLHLGERLRSYIKQHPEEWIFWGKNEASS